jgi:hypothetical protein
MSRSPHFTSLVLLGGALISVCGGVTGGAGQNAPIPGDFSRCMALTGDAARLHCFESLVGKPSPPARTTGGWRLIRTGDPRGGADAVSIMHTADISRSDPDFAGLMVRCAERDVEALVVVIEPQAPSARPQVKLGLPGREQSYMAAVVPPFTALLLPAEAMSQLTSAAVAGPDLSIELDSEGASVHGLVALAGLSRALDDLRGNCSRP